MFKYPKTVLLSIKTFLETHLLETKKRLKRLDRQDPFGDSSRLNDNASIDTEAKEQIGHETVSALKKEMEEKQNKIIKALNKIKKDQYGFCEKCHKLIDTERLEAFPMAELCVACEKQKNLN